MDERKNQSDFEKLLTWFFVAAALAFVVVVVAYVLRFGPNGLSRNAADWADFGEYVGGTLGGFFGLLAFIGVLFSMQQQRTQLEFLRGQANRDEVQRLTASVAEALDEILNKEPAMVPERVARQLGGNTQAITVAHMLTAGGRWGVRRFHPDYLVRATSAELLTGSRACLMLDAGQLNIQLDQLARCLTAYRGAGGSETVISIYTTKARMYATSLAAMDFAISDCVMEYYRVIDLLEGLKSSEGAKPE
jgi:hypothetical protein